MKKLAVALCLVASLGACADEPGPPTAEPAGTPADVESAFGPEEISLGELFAQIRGHHDAATQLYDGGDTDLALVHAGHPIDEILASVAPELEEHSPDHAAELEAALVEVRELIESDASKQEVAAATDVAAELTFEAQEALVGAATADPAFVGSVIASLLGTTAHEYEEATAGGEGISLLEEYQDGFAFLAEAKDLYEEIVGEVESASREEAREIQEAFDELDAAFPDLEAPTEPVDAAVVEDAAELIAHELEETVGAEPVEASDPDEIAENIETLLAEVVETYEAGDADGAAELTAEVYLENYEVIEAQVIEAAPEINEELEPLLGADLRKEITAGAPVSEIQAMVDRALVLLGQALEALEAH